MLTSATQRTAKRRLEQRRTKMVSARGSGMLTPLQNIALQKERWNERRINTGIRVEDQQLTPLQHNALLKESAGISAEQNPASVSEDHEC
jgi:hypothetical protein